VHSKRIVEENKQSVQKPLLVSFLANISVGIVKLICFFFTKSVSIFAETIHSFCDAFNQVFLAIGIIRSNKKPDNLHNFGFGRERYFYSLLVGILLFTGGGVYSLYEGISKLLSPHRIENYYLALFILLFSMIAESIGLKTALKSANNKPSKNKVKSYYKYILDTKTGEKIILILEDIAAVISLFFALVCTSISYFFKVIIFDAIGSILIGSLLIIVAIFILKEIKSLIVGEGLSAKKLSEVKESIYSTNQVKYISRIKSVFLSPDECLLLIDIDFNDDVDDVKHEIDLMEERIKNDFQNDSYNLLIYIEP
jgi:cation diffusion facilitator family transporter